MKKSFILLLLISAVLLLNIAWLQLSWKWISSALHDYKVPFLGMGKYPVHEMKLRSSQGKLSC